MTVTTFRVERVVRGICPVCDSDTDVRIGRDVIIGGSDGSNTGPLQALVECPTCGVSIADPHQYDAPHNHRL